MTDSKESQAETFPKLLRIRAKQSAGRPAMREKAYGIWQTWTWDGFAEEAFAFAGGLAQLGFTSNDKLVIIGDNRPRLYGAMVAAQALGDLLQPA
jgi:long-chain acyl-CoA synthetase